MELNLFLPNLAWEAVEAQACDIESYNAGKISEEIFKSRRVPRGIYAQRGEEQYMMRVRIPGGILFSGQMRSIAELSSEYTSAPLHITTRQDMQFHDVPLGKTAKMMQRLLVEGLTPLGGGGNTVRNITCCSHSGFYAEEEFDVLPHVLRLTEYFLSQKSSYNLPRKFKIAFSCCAEDNAFARLNDLGFIAKKQGEKRGFAIYVGGGMGAISRSATIFKQFLPETEIIPLTVAVLKIFDRYGDRRNRHRARLRFVIERLGEKRFFYELEKELEKAIKDGMAEVSLDGSSIKAVISEEEELTWAHEKSGGEDSPVFNYKSEKVPQFQHLVRAQKQKGYFSIILPLKRGNIFPEDLTCLAELTEKYASSQVRLDRRQNIIVPFVPHNNVEIFCLEVEKKLECFNNDPEAWMVSCKGADTCKLGICRAQDLNEAISRKAKEAGIPSSVFSELEIHSSGCPNNCGQHSAAVFGFFGVARRKNGRSYPLYNVVAGGKKEGEKFHLSEEVGKIPAKSVPNFTVELLKDYLESEMSVKNFSYYWENSGYRRAQELISKFSEVPPYIEEPSYYHDWGAQEEFSLAGRTAGECGAGVVELIAEELKRSERALSRAEKESRDDDEKAEQLLEAAAAAAGSLLVTRGIEPGDPDTSFREFERRFLDEGLVSEKHRDILVDARGALRGSKEVLNSKAGEIRELLDEVQNLYDHMDASLNFSLKKKRTAGDEEKKQNRNELDLRGVACPMNFVHSKMALEKLPAGSELEIILDKGEPVENVPRSFEDQGEEVISITPEGEEHFRVVVRRN